MHSQIYYAYPWYLSYGHLLVAAAAVPLFLWARARRWNRLLQLLVGAVSLWSITAFLAVRFGMDPNGAATMPPVAFQERDGGRVLDMGAGSGRSSIMVLQARPHSTLVALDEFGESYTEHFDTENQAMERGRERLLANFRAAGVADRASVQAGDMRKMPFAAETFDGIVSAYAIDHLSAEGIREALAEADRVLKPGGDFLLILINKDFWAEYTWGLAFLHSRTAGADYWTRQLAAAGFKITEQGTQPATLYLLAHKR